ncbi:unnamed protein product [Cyprideis torosa]|uniref:Phosphodiesterase n=1 Tax=Cyprideis torosa TaxID=163714 RepID=A0A7R8W428_9CRUS|nr:unnamed protein product [Cyprideis torosa]CAG0883666.1 unnamed protein product [Cyprideis torosa]
MKRCSETTCSSAGLAYGTRSSMNEVLLDLARITFQEQSTIETIVSRIMIHMQSLLQAERCQVLLTHEASKASFSRVFDLEVQEDPASETYSRSVAYENRTPLNVGVTGHVASTGETVNIADASGDERCDQHSGLVMKHILSMPIKNAINQIIGVVQLINKLPPGNESGFTKNDEHFLEAFAIFCGMGLHNTQMYERAVIAVAKQEVTLEVLSYHATAPQEDVLKLMQRAKVPSGQFFRLHDFKFDDYGLYEDDTLKACLRMFMDLDLIERFNIDRQVLCRWLLSIRRNYRPVIYHNWRHAFSVAQMMFAILLSTQWWKGLGDLDCLALLIACLSHDLDHRGTNNSFQVKMSSPLAQMYTTSILEHHHFDQCVMILNSQGNQILSHLRPDEYKTVVTIIEEAILATDLANFFKNKGKFAELVESEKFNWADPEHRFLLRAMTMTACDIGAITKPWSTQKRVAELVAGEFFEQGDLEKEKLNITPIDMMNREKRDRLPELQVEFIDVICLPVYEALCKLSPALQPLLSGVQNNRMRWKTMADAVIVSAEKHKKANGTGTGIKTATTTSSS